FRCRNCGAMILDTEANRQISLAFRRQVGLLTPDEIREKREALGLKQGELAAYLSVAPATLSRWENGVQIQQRCMDKLLRLFFDLPEVRFALGTAPEATTADRFRCLKPTPELRRQAQRFRLTSASRPAPVSEPAAQPEQEDEMAAGDVLA